MNWFKSDKNPVFFIAEIGGNHEGNFETARKMLRLAAESGADAAKFQIYTGETLVNGSLSPDRVAHFNRFMLPLNQYQDLAEEAKRLGILFMASVWNYEGLDVLGSQISIHKVGSGDLTYYPMLKALVDTDKPIILSTGMATLDEVKDAHHFIRSVNPTFVKEGKLALLQCTSMYPIPDEDANLSAMPLLQAATGCPVGYSDHTVGALALEVAVAMGAQILEKHFTDSREGKTFRDHQLSLTKDEVKSFLERARSIKRLQGNASKEVMPSEKEHRVSMRRGVFPARDLPKGTIIRAEDLVFLRPSIGVDAREYNQLIGKKTTVDLKRNEQLDWKKVN